MRPWARIPTLVIAGISLVKFPVGTVVGGLTPLEEEYEMVGASSDLSVVNLGDNPRGVKVGDTLSFRPSYGAFVRLMMDPYIDKVLVSREQAREALKAESSHFDVPPILDGLESGDPPGSTPADILPAPLTRALVCQARARRHARSSTLSDARDRTRCPWRSRRGCRRRTTRRRSRGPRRR